MGTTLAGGGVAVGSSRERGGVGLCVCVPPRLNLDREAAWSSTFVAVCFSNHGLGHTGDNDKQHTRTASADSPPSARAHRAHRDAHMLYAHPPTGPASPALLHPPHRVGGQRARRLPPAHSPYFPRLLILRVGRWRRRTARAASRTPAARRAVQGASPQRKRALQCS